MIAIAKNHFYAKTAPAGDCLVWTGERKGGRLDYGRVRIGGKRFMSHRISFEMAMGPIPEGMFVCHKCDNPPCVKIDHLFLGTAKDNSADMVAKGRHVIPEFSLNAAKTSCPNGHSYDKSNTRFATQKTGVNRICRRCDADRNRAKYHAKSISEATLIGPRKTKTIDPLKRAIGANK